MRYFWLIALLASAKLSCEISALLRCTFEKSSHELRGFVGPFFTLGCTAPSPSAPCSELGLALRLGLGSGSGSGSGAKAKPGVRARLGVTVAPAPPAAEGW